MHSRILTWKAGSIGNVKDYEAACGRCEKYVVIPTLALLLTIRSRLGRDGRQKSGKARFLKRDVPELGLLVGDEVVEGLDLCISATMCDPCWGL